MGRRKDTPAVQSAKNYSGRRKGQEIEASKTSTKAEDDLLAALDIGGLRPPARFARKQFAQELKVWRDLVPRLKVLSRLSSEFQAPLAAYCDCVVRYNKAVTDLKRGGTYKEVKTVSGDSMQRLNPAERVRQKALEEILSLADRFGLTPRDNFALMKDHRDLIDRGVPLQGNFFAPAPQGDASQQPDALGGMDGYDSPPPSRQH